MSDHAYRLQRFVHSYDEARDAASEWQQQGAFNIEVSPPSDGVMMWRVSAQMAIKLPPVQLGEYTATATANY